MVVQFGVIHIQTMLMKEDRYILLAHKSVTGQLSTQEKKELDRWMAENPHNKTLIESIITVWNIVEHNTIFPSPNASHQQQQWEQLHQKLQQLEPVNIKQNYLALKWASSIAACVCLAVTIWLLLHTYTHTNKLITATSNLEITLSDSTRMNLRKDAQLIISEGNKRHVQLTGEAWMNINPDKTKPFEIEVTGGIIRTTGGQVYIKSNSNHAEIILLIGTATVNVNGTNVILKENKKFVIQS